MKFNDTTNSAKRWWRNNNEAKAVAEKSMIGDAGRQKFAQAHSSVRLVQTIMQIFENYSATTVHLTIFIVLRLKKYWKLLKFTTSQEWNTSCAYVESVSNDKSLEAIFTNIKKWIVFGLTRHLRYTQFYLIYFVYKNIKSIDVINYIILFYLDQQKSKRCVIMFFISNQMTCRIRTGSSSCGCLLTKPYYNH
ncbi:hypothetical protein AGLY_008773 [Aphis glycines]|uniref:Uncharacterized protein n=1 Tax=Aphis glycines TaxID=307491 RepID=A0A6G0TLS0_APHGL|nr:hypothetical protein AGLY_008773 [Aphis glycines]